MSFEKMLERLHESLQSMVGVDRGTDCFDYTKTQLGNWAWEKIEYWLTKLHPSVTEIYFDSEGTISGIRAKTPPIAWGDLAVWLKIAVTCFGQYEVKKRLEALKCVKKKI